MERIKKVDADKFAMNLRDLAEGRLMMRVNNGVLVPMSMLARAAEIIEARADHIDLLELARACLARFLSAGHNVPPLEYEDVERLFFRIDAALAAHPLAPSVVGDHKPQNVSNKI